jgi:hypothetical protein
MQAPSLRLDPARYTHAGKAKGIREHACREQTQGQTRKHACMQAMHHAPASVLVSGALPTGHHPGFGKWCKLVPLGSIAKGSDHTIHISSRPQRRCQQQTVCTRLGQQKPQHGRQPAECNTIVVLPPPRPHSRREGPSLPGQRQAGD